MMRRRRERATDRRGVGGEGCATRRVRGPAPQGVRDEPAAVTDVRARGRRRCWICCANGRWPNGSACGGTGPAATPARGEGEPWRGRLPGPMRLLPAARTVRYGARHGDVEGRKRNLDGFPEVRLGVPTVNVRDS